MGTGERIFWSFILVLISAILLVLHLTDASYAFQTDHRTDRFTVVTPLGGTTGNVTLQKLLYGNDVSTLSFLSETAADSPHYVSYNTTTRALIFSGLSANLTRTIEIGYDIQAPGVSGYIAGIVDSFSGPVFLIIIIAFPLAGFAAIWFMGRNNE